MNKKAEINMYVLGGIIAATILVIIFVGPINDVLVEFGQNFFGNAPSFNESTIEPAMIGLVRYDILMDKVQIYDGERWTDFNKDIQFKSMQSPVSEAEVNSAFEEYYFDVAARTGNTLFINDSISVTAIDVASGEFVDNSIFISWFDEQVYSRGATVISVKPKSQAVLGYYFLDLDGGMKYKENNDQPEDEPLTSAARNEVKAKAASWRDSVFAKPRISINGQEFCLRKQAGKYLFDNRYLSVDLSRIGEVCQ